jgi:hypothetical protein
MALLNKFRDNTLVLRAHEMAASAPPLTLSASYGVFRRL